VAIGAAVALAWACSAYVHHLNTPPFDGYPPHAKVPLSVALTLSNDLKNAYVESAGERVPLGTILSENSKRLASQVFAAVVGGEGEAGSKRPDAILMPKLVSVAHTRPMAAFSDRRMTAVVEWVLTDPRGAVVWVDTVQGEGVNQMGGAFTLTKNTEERVKLLTDDLFRKSFLKMVAAVEIQEYAAKVSRRGAPAPGAIRGAGVNR
jgi:hypothetical protein